MNSASLYTPGSGKWAGISRRCPANRHAKTPAAGERVFHVVDADGRTSARGTRHAAVGGGVGA